MLYAFTSGANNNGSAFAGLAADTPFYDAAIGAVMLLGRFGSIVLVLGLAGALGAQATGCPASAGTFPTTSPLFAVLLGGVVVIVDRADLLPRPRPGPLAEGLT